MTRVVRTTDDFEAYVDFALGPERGPNGEPSAHDFLASRDLQSAIRKFAEAWESLPEETPGNSRFRVLVASHRLVGGMALYGELMPDDTIELFAVRFDFNPWSGAQ